MRFPRGKFQFYGYVHYADGTLLGEREGDEPQFDPGVLTEGENTYLYTGFCFAGDKSRHGPMCTVLGPDMLTIRQEPVFIAPSQPYSQGSGFEGHEFFEAPSIRKAGDTYYFIYSSVVFHELCYATSKSPTQGFQYGGVIISNNDLGIGTYKSADKPMYYGGNNHGSMVQIGEKWYIFYHRQTNGTSFSRQAMAQEIQILPDGSIPQVEMTSCASTAAPWWARALSRPHRLQPVLRLGVHLLRRHCRQRVLGGRPLPPGHPGRPGRRPGARLHPEHDPLCHRWLQVFPLPGSHQSDFAGAGLLQRRLPD